MTSDRRNDDVDSDLAWFEGLAGRSDGSKAAQDGERVRVALRDSTVTSKAQSPGWQAVVERGSGPAGVDRSKALAANDPPRTTVKPWRWAMAATVAIAAGLGAWRMTNQESAPVMRGSVGQAAVVWRTAMPRESAELLAAELRALGATVLVLPQANAAFVVRVEAPEASRGAVNGRLAPLEAALDSGGRLEMIVSDR